MSWDGECLWSMNYRKGGVCLSSQRKIWTALCPVKSNRHTFCIIVTPSKLHPGRDVASIVDKVPSTVCTMASRAAVLRASRTHLQETQLISNLILGSVLARPHILTP